MGVLARADEDALTALWTEWPDKPNFEWLRKPERGLVMVRGRMGGTGARFNLGEMTVTRCVVRLTDGTLGHAIVQGRAQDKAEIAALVDALYQNPATEEGVEARILAPLAEAADSRQRARAAETAATRVDFFTMVRGED